LSLMLLVLLAHTLKTSKHMVTGNVNSRVVARARLVIHSEAWRSAWVSARRRTKN